MALFITLFGAALLILGAELMLRGSVVLALRARIAPVVIGLTVVSMGTSAPELVVSVLAALKGSAGIAMGNVIGSNVVNISLILGLCVIIFPIGVDRDALRIHWPVMMGASVLLIVLLSDQVLSQVEGLIFLAALISYVTIMIMRSRRKWDPASVASSEKSKGMWKAVALVVVGAAGLTYGGDRLVVGATDLALMMGISERLVGLTVVAAGTSMPELAASLVAAFRKQPDISLGNLLGSNIFNILAILGTASILHPITVVPGMFTIDLWVMVGFALLIFPLARFTSKLGRVQGSILVATYLIYLAYLIQRG